MSADFGALDIAMLCAFFDLGDLLHNYGMFIWYPIEYQYVLPIYSLYILYIYWLVVDLPL